MNYDVIDTDTLLALLEKIKSFVSNVRQVTMYGQHYDFTLSFSVNDNGLVFDKNIEIYLPITDACPEFSIDDFPYTEFGELTFLFNDQGLDREGFCAELEVRAYSDGYDEIWDIDYLCIELNSKRTVSDEDRHSFLVPIKDPLLMQEFKELETNSLRPYSFEIYLTNNEKQQKQAIEDIGKNLNTKQKVRDLINSILTVFNLRLIPKSKT